MDLDFDGIHEKIVMINCESELGGQTSGSGFIAEMDGKTYLVTSKRILFGAESITFKTISGKRLKPRSVELSTTSNLARLLLADEDGFKLNNAPEVGLPIGVFGNSGGGGVATEIYGRVNKVDRGVIEISAPFVDGNSGSPVLNADRQVIAMASHVQYTSEKEGGWITRRMICHRINGNQWKAVNWKKYNQKYGQIYLKERAAIDPLISVIQQWAANPYGPIYVPDVKDPEIQKLIGNQRGGAGRLPDPDA